MLNSIGIGKRPGTSIFPKDLQLVPMKLVRFRPQCLLDRSDNGASCKGLHMAGDVVVCVQFDDDPSERLITQALPGHIALCPHLSELADDAIAPTASGCAETLLC